MKYKIIKNGINGEGIAYENKLPVFISGALKDELVNAKVYENNKNYKRAKIIKILEKSPLRIKPICPYYERCGACSLLHTTYKNQLEIKKDILKESLYKYAGINIDVEVLGSDKPFNYRNSLKLPFCFDKGKLKLAIYENDSNLKVPIEKCLIHEELLEEIKNKVLDVLNKYKLKIYDNKTNQGLRYLYLRVLDGKCQMALITGNDKLDNKLIEDFSKIDNLESVYQFINTKKNTIDIFSNHSIHLYGKKYLHFKINKFKFEINVKSFFQLNTLQAKRLYRLVSDKVPNDNNLLVEAYCGIGAMSLLNADKAKEVVGIEYSKAAIDNAKYNGKLNKLTNTKFIVGDAGEVIKTKFKHQKINTLIVDPPRSGLDDLMLETIMLTDIKNIIYVSCNPATLAKNLNILKSKYIIKSIEAIDMFPETAHLETIVLLTVMK